MTTDILAGLNPRQREAVEAIEGPLLIVAGPGSGKTRVITHRIAYLVRVCGVTPHRIAAVTFTNKAAKEMRQRLVPLLGPSVKDLTAGTFHAFCAMVLRRDGASIGLDRNFTIYDDADQIELIKRSMKEVEVDPKRFSPRAIQSAISTSKSQLLGAGGFALKRENYFDEIVGRVYERSEALMAQSSAVDFDDLLLKTYLLFDRFPEVARKYQDRYVHFMIDEFQDTNVAQYAIAKQLSQGYRNLCVVGDPDQSIYSWRNADIRNILSFQEDYPEARVIALEENYRSTQNILDAAKELIAVNSQRVEKSLWTSNGPGVPIVVSEGYDQDEEAQFVVKTVSDLRQSDGYALGDMAVMYRVNAQSRALEDTCLRYGVPYQLVGGTKFYQRQEVKDVTAYLRLVANPDDDVAFTRVVNVPPRGIGRRTVDELTRVARDLDVSAFAAIQRLAGPHHEDQGTVPAQLGARAARALSGFRDLVTGLAADGKELDLLGLIDLVLDRTGYRDHLLGEAERGEERLENIQEFRVAAQDYIYLGPEDALAEFLESVSLVSDVDSLEEKANALTLITLHQAKGLEFRVVFIVGMEEGLLPHFRSMDDPGEMEEERRLCYVGFTRAKERLYLLRAFRRALWGSSAPGIPSRFLQDIPRDLIVLPAPAREARRGPRHGRPGLGSWRPSAAGQGTPGDGWGGVASPGARAAPGEATLSTGDKVRHATFGEGIVTACKASAAGDDMEVTVAFREGGGVKRLLLSFAPLEKLEPADQTG